MSAFNGFGNIDAYNEGAYEAQQELDLLSEETQDAIFESMLLEEASHFTNEEMKAFLESDLCEELVTEGKMRRNTIVLLSKQDDQSRRNKIIAMQMAKENRDPLWEKLRKNRVIERNLLGKIMKKYGRKAQKVAKAQQKDWIKNRMPANFGKFGGADRVSKDAPSTKPFERKYGIHSGK